MTPEEVTRQLQAVANEFKAISGKPTNSDLQNISKTIHPILINIPYNEWAEQESARQNLIGIILDDPAYKKHYGTNFVPPKRPSRIIDFDKNATRAQIRTEETRNAVKLEDYKLYEAANAACTQFVISNIDEVWVISLRDQHLLYKNVSFKQLINHLTVNAEGLHPFDLVEIPNEMAKVMEDSETLTHYIQQMEKLQTLAERGGLPVSDNHMLARTIKVLTTAEMYTETMGVAGEWGKLIKAQQTWDKFKVVFLEAEALLNTVLSAKGNTPFSPAAHVAQAGLASYHGQANAATDTSSYPPVQTTELSNILDNLACSVTNDAGLLREFTNNLTALTTSNATLITTNEKLTGQTRRMQEQINSLQKKLSIDATTPGGQPTDTAKREWKKNEYSKDNPDPLWTKGAYCWSHGYGCRDGHNSKTCAKRKVGHKEEATRANTMGGADVMQGWDA